MKNDNLKAIIKEIKKEFGFKNNNELESYISQYLRKCESDNSFKCSKCNNVKECFIKACDSHYDIVAFNDIILNSGYVSEDDFWECNGI